MMILRPMLVWGLVVGLVLSMAPVAADAAPNAAGGAGQSKRAKTPSKSKKGGHVHFGTVISFDGKTLVIKPHHGKKSKSTAKAGAGNKPGAANKVAVKPKVAGAGAGGKSRKGHGLHFTVTEKTTGDVKSLAPGEKVLVKSERSFAENVKILKAGKKAKKPKKN